MLLHVLLAKFVKLPLFHLIELYYKVVTLGAWIGSKDTSGYVIVQELLLYIFVVVVSYNYKG